MTNALHNRLLQTIAADDAARLQDEAPVAPHGADIPQEEQWWDHLITHSFQRDETSLFVDLRIDRAVFNVLLNAIEDLLQTRGRRSFINSHREQLRFLHVYMAFGTNVLSLLVSPRIRSVCELNRIARRIAFLYGRRLKEIFIVNREEGRTDPRGVGYVIDCTVVKIKHPCVPFNEAKVWFSGKHFIYYIKKEVVVNARTGSAALVSPGRSGSVHDLTVMRGNADTINRLVGDAVILGDKGYRGGTSAVRNLFVVEDVDPDAFRNKRVLVECFFGRLKKKYGVFGRSGRCLSNSSTSSSTALVQ